MTAKTYEQTIREAANDVAQMRDRYSGTHKDFLFLMEIERRLKVHFPPPLDVPPKERKHKRDRK